MLRRITNYPMEERCLLAKKYFLINYRPTVFQVYSQYRAFRFIVKLVAKRPNERKYEETGNSVEYISWVQFGFLVEPPTKTRRLTTTVKSKQSHHLASYSGLNSGAGSDNMVKLTVSVSSLRSLIISLPYSSTVCSSNMIFFSISALLVTTALRLVLLYHVQLYKKERLVSGVLGVFDTLAFVCRVC